jgi:uncharacterized membrane protein YraQ (UPF0718 family)
LATRDETLGLSSSTVSTRRLLAGTLVFLALLVIGLFIVKWLPYWHKAHVAAATHSIGASIVSGKSTAAPSVGIAAAWSYSVAYFTAVWQAVLLALILGAAVPVFVPRRWLHRLIGGNSFGSAAVAGGLSLAGMM